MSLTDLGDLKPSYDNKYTILKINRKEDGRLIIGKDDYDDSIQYFQQQENTEFAIAHFEEYLSKIIQGLGDTDVLYDIISTNLSLDPICRKKEALEAIAANESGKYFSPYVRAGMSDIYMSFNLPKEVRTGLLEEIKPENDNWSDILCKLKHVQVDATKSQDSNTAYVVNLPLFLQKLQELGYVIMFKTQSCCGSVESVESYLEGLELMLTEPHNTTFEVLADLSEKGKVKVNKNLAN